MKVSPTTKKYISAGIVCAVVLVVAIVFSSGSRSSFVDCDKLFQENTSDTVLPVTCEVTMSEKGEKLQVTFTEKGDLAIARKNNTIFSLAALGDEDDAAGIEVLGYGENRTLAAEAVSFEDVTFDGFRDLVVRSSAGAYNFTYAYYAYNPAAKNFDPEPILEATNPTVDLASKTIESFSKGRGFADIYFLEIYRFEDGKYILIKSESQDIIGDFNAIPAIYERVISERREGKMIEVERKQLSEEDINTFAN